MKKYTWILLFALLGCTNPYDESQLVGTWEGVRWQDVTHDKTLNISFGFTFRDNGQYVGRYGNNTEEGTYWIADEFLHTIEEGKSEKKVKITQLNQDTLVFSMNRAGTMEEMVLVKE